MEITRSSVDNTVKIGLETTDLSAQAKAHGYFTRVPTSKEIPDHGFVLAEVSGTLYTYTRIGVKIYRAAFTAV